MSILVCYCVCSDLMLLSTTTGLVLQRTMTPVSGGVRCHCSPAMSVNFAGYCRSRFDRYIFIFIHQ